MSDLDTMRPEVRDALEVIAGEAVCTCHEAYTSRGMKDPACNHDLKGYVDTIRAELLRLAAENAAARGALETLDVEGHKRAEHAEAELAALKARIAGSRHAFLGPNMDRITFLADEIGPNGEYALVKVED